MQTKNRWTQSYGNAKLFVSLFSYVLGVMVLLVLLWFLEQVHHFLKL